MNTAYSNSTDFSFYSDAQVALDSIIAELKADSNADSDHGEIESLINKQGQEILRTLLQGYLDQTAANESQKPYVVNQDGNKLNRVRNNTKTKMTSLFGHVVVTRKGYWQNKQGSVFPLDAQLNLAGDQYSDGIRYRLAREAIKGSFDDAVESIKDTTGGHVPKRQSISLVRDIAQDFNDYYLNNRYLKKEETLDLLILSFDGKGIVMRPDGLRECTKKNAKKSKKLNSRLSQGEKKDRKRMAQVAAVYTVKANVRAPESIMKADDNDANVKTFRVPPRNKRVWASVEQEAGSVIEEAFLEALARDPEKLRNWVILVDGHIHQLELINRVMKRLKVKATIIMDFIHVLEYLWKAAWCFFDKGDSAVEKWIAERAVKILNGHCNQVAKGLKQSATKRKLVNRDNIDKCAKYLLNNKARLQYGVALAAGHPIASGVIEGACRHLINDRLDITGARWSLQGAEALLKLRSLKSSGDLDSYWGHHKQQSKQRFYGTNC